ncbi:hypothetical protein DV736_g1359, partial [Chaetothyriales sp. CBS 134916]
MATAGLEFQQWRAKPMNRAAIAAIPHQQRASSGPAAPHSLSATTATASPSTLARLGRPFVPPTPLQAATLARVDSQLLNRLSAWSATTAVLGRRVLCDHATATAITTTPSALVVLGHAATTVVPSCPHPTVTSSAAAPPQPSQPVCYAGSSDRVSPSLLPAVGSIRLTIAAASLPSRRTTAWDRQRLQYGLAPRRLTSPVLPTRHTHRRRAKRRSRILSHAPSMPVHMASVMSTPYPYPSFMSVYGSDESQLEEIPDCVCYEQAKEPDRRAGQISSKADSGPATIPSPCTHHALPLAIHHRGSINSFASDSTTPSPTTSHSSPSFSDPSPTSSPESACSNPCLCQFKGTMAAPSSDHYRHRPPEQALVPQQTEVAVHAGQDLAGHASRNVKKLSLNMTSALVARPGSVGAVDSHLPFSVPSSPMKEPLRSGRKKPTNLTIRTPGFQQLAFPRNPTEVPPTPSSRRSIHTLASSPSLPSVNTPTTSSPGLHVLLPSLGSGHSRPGSDSSVSSQCVSALPEVREELEAPRSQETQENGYPDGPVCIYDCGVYLYLEPTAEEARQFDTVINVAKEIKNPFDKAGPEHGTVMSTWRHRESQDSIPEPQTAISEASFKSAWETQPIETPTPRGPGRQPEYVHVPWDHNSEILDDLPPLCRLIDDRTRRGKKVLIHCQLGVSRSASLTIAYGLWVGYQPDFHSMYMQVKQRSPWVGPNMGLIYQLTDFRARVKRGEEIPSEDPSKTPTAKAPPLIRLDKELPPVPLFEQEDKPRRLPHVVTQMSPGRERSPAQTVSPPATKAAATTPRPLPFRTLAEYANPRPIPPHKAWRAPPPAGVAVDRAQASTEMDLASQDVPHTPSLFSPRSAEFVATPIGISHSVGEIVVAGPPEGPANARSKSRPQSREDALSSTVDPRSPHQSPASKEITGSIDGVDNVTLARRGQQITGTLHLTSHHIIFLWITYPIIAFCTLRPSPPASRQPSSIRLRGRDFTFVCFYLADDRTAREVYDSIRAWTCKLGRIEKLYAFSYQPQRPERDIVPSGWAIYDPVKEWARMGVGQAEDKRERNKNWRLSRINADYHFSPTYPALVAVPAAISDNTLKYAAAYRSRARIPVLTYLHPVNSCSITRSSQPMVGVRGHRSIQDETLLAAIFSTTRAERPLSAIATPAPEREDSGSTSTSKETAVDGDLHHTNAEALEDAGRPRIYGAQQRNMIVDARPTVNAYVMQAAGLGTENMDNYKFATKAYLGIDNIHVMRDSLQKVVDALKDSDLSPIGPSKEALHKSHWLKHIANMLEGVSLIARQVALQHSHVLIHCSDGWDRTSQLSALSQICLDPYYRTMHGFIVLVEKDWLSFGHMFKHRTGFLSSDKWFQIENERIAGRGEQTDDANAPTDAISGAQRKLENALLSARGFFTKQNNDSRESINVDSETEPSPAADSESTTAAGRPRLVPGAGGSGKDDKAVTKVKETAPIFHQFLDATYQLMYQHPTRFEFSERFLRRLLYHLYSCQYGTFLLDNERQRKEARLSDRTRSVWDYFLSRKEEFLNPNYDPVIDDKVRGKERLIFPRTDEVRWWHELFGRTDEEMNGRPFERSSSSKLTVNGDGQASVSLANLPSGDADGKTTTARQPSARHYTNTTPQTDNSSANGAPPITIAKEKNVAAALSSSGSSNLSAMSTIGPAVQSLSSSLALLRSATDILETGVADYPRLTRVLSTQQHFELLPEPQLHAAQQSLVSEIAPAISQLLATADKYVDELARRDEGLKARYELLTGRLEGQRRRQSSSMGQPPGKSAATATPRDMAEDAGGRALEAKLLRQKKERLQYAIDRLELQMKQRERELRKSMAVVRE